MSDSLDTTPDRISVCPLEGPLSIFASKWKPTILFHLFEKKRLRHGELRRHVGTISQRVMTSQLRDLERDGLVVRTAHETVPANVDYAPTDLAWSIHSIFVAIHKWGDQHMKTVAEARARYDDPNNRETNRPREVKE